MGANVRPLILTGWTGDQWKPVADVTLPLMRAYAERHGCDFSWAELAGPRPPSWQKIIALRQTLPGRPAVAWIDADVVIEDGTKSIFDELPDDKDQALVEHLTGDGPVPNCGVWVLRPAMFDSITQAWDCNRHIAHNWWEQAVMLEMMGYVVNGCTAQLDAPTTLHQRTAWLGSEWNDHPADRRRAKQVRFRHVTQYANRLEAVRHFAAVAACKS
jgi:hypothetical protein